MERLSLCTFGRSREDPNRERGEHCQRIPAPDRIRYEEPLEEGQFYAHLKPLEKGGSSTTYYPIREVKAYSLDSLPTEKQFLADLESADD